MVPEIGKKYFLWYEPHLYFFKSESRKYRGVGIYSGDSILESDGKILYLFNDINNKIIGWFSADDIFFYD
jgi:hypothetical protein